MGQFKKNETKTVTDEVIKGLTITPCHPPDVVLRHNNHICVYVITTLDRLVTIPYLKKKLCYQQLLIKGSGHIMSYYVIGSYWCGHTMSAYAMMLQLCTMDNFQ